MITDGMNETDHAVTGGDPPRLTVWTSMLLHMGWKPCRARQRPPSDSTLQQVCVIACRLRKLVEEVISTGRSKQASGLSSQLRTRILLDRQ